MTFWIINTIIDAYIISTIVFLTLILFFKSLRKRTNDYLNKANLIIVLVLLLNIIWVGQETVECYVEHKKNNLNDVDIAYQQNCFSHFIRTFLFAFIFQIIFIFNRQRTKVLLSIVSVLLLTIPYNIERIVIFVTNLYRDYIPPTWSSYFDNSSVYWTLSATFFYFFICWTTFKKAAHYFIIK